MVTCCSISLGERIFRLVGHKTGLNLDLEDCIAHPLFRNRYTKLKTGGSYGGGSDEDVGVLFGSDDDVEDQECVHQMDSTC